MAKNFHNLSTALLNKGGKDLCICRNSLCVPFARPFRRPVPQPTPSNCLWDEATGLRKGTIFEELYLPLEEGGLPRGR